MAKRNSSKSSSSSVSPETPERNASDRAADQPNARQESSRSSQSESDAPGTFGVTDKGTQMANPDREIDDNSLGRSGDLSDDSLDDSTSRSDR